MNKNNKKGANFLQLAPFGFMCDLDRIQTCNLLSRNQMRYSVAPRGRCLKVCKYNTFLVSLKHESKIFTGNHVFSSNQL